MGSPGVLHGSFSYLLQDEDGQVIEPHSISAGLDYPGIGPEHAFLKDVGRAEYFAITDAEALEAFKRVTRLEGIIPALETSHAFAYLEKLCPQVKPGTRVRGQAAPVGRATRLGPASREPPPCAWPGRLLTAHVSALSLQIVINCSGRGDKDVNTVAKALGLDI